METASINPASPYGNTAEDHLSGEALSGEALLLYLSTRLSDLDSDINALMGEAQDAIDRKQYLHDMKEWADRYRAAVKANGEAADPERMARVVGDCPEPPPGMRDLQTEAMNVGASTDALKRFEALVDRMIDEVNGQSELCMIRLQQLMSQRQLAVQLATNLLSKLNTGFESIVNNLK